MLLKHKERPCSCQSILKTRFYQGFRSCPVLARDARGEDVQPLLTCYSWTVPAGGQGRVARRGWTEKVVGNPSTGDGKGVVSRSHPNPHAMYTPIWSESTSMTQHSSVVPLWSQPPFWSPLFWFLSPYFRFPRLLLNGQAIECNTIYQKNKSCCFES